MQIYPTGNIVVYTGSDGIHIEDGNVITIDEAKLALIDNSVQKSQIGQPLGVPGLDALSTIPAIVRVQYLTAGEADTQTFPPGVIAVTSDTKELRYGDGNRPGGFRAGLNSKNMIYVSASGTALENGAALVAAYNLARTIDPNNLPKSATNRMYIMLGCGTYDTNASITWDTSFIDLIGLDMIGVRVKFGGLCSIMESCYDWAWKNITFYKDVANYNVQWRFNDTNLTPIQLYWENLRFEGGAADTILTSLSRQNGSTSSFNGTIKNVKTACAQMLCAASGFTGHTVALNFDDCQAGNRYISGIGGNRPTFTGSMIKCVWTNTLATAYDVASGAILHNTKFGSSLNFILSGSRITYCRFVPTAAVASLKGASAGQTAYIAHCELSATGIDATNLTNSAGANPYNVLSDN